MGEKPQFAFTGPTPAAGYVGYVNIQEVDDGVRFLVRSESGSDAARFVIPPDPPTASYVIPKDEAIKLLSAALTALGGPPKHDFWRAGEPDCPAEIKAGNGELHTLRCKRCGQDDPRSDICTSA